MDRDTTIALAASIIVLTLIGSLYLSPTGKTPGSGLEARAAAAGVEAGNADATQAAAPPVVEPPSPSATTKFKPDDIRFKYQQAELKKGKKRKFMQAVPEEPAGGEPGSENEEPAAEEPSGDSSSDRNSTNTSPKMAQIGVSSSRRPKARGRRRCTLPPAQECPYGACAFPTRRA
jgi:hypothetical protein